MEAQRKREAASGRPLADKDHEVRMVRQVHEGRKEHGIHEEHEVHEGHKGREEHEVHEEHDERKEQKLGQPSVDEALPSSAALIP